MARPLFPLPAFAALALAVLAPSAAHAQSASAPAEGNAALVAACEKAARQALSPRPGAAEVSFGSPPSVQAGTDGGQTVLRGSGRVRSSAGVRGFSYSCNVDARSGEALGVVIRDSAPATAAATAQAVRPVEPDLSQLSPTACESSAAVALKQRWPRVSQISFDPATRTLAQDSSGRAELRGQGRALPTPESPSTHFGFSCTLDARNGRVLDTRISG